MALMWMMIAIVAVFVVVIFTVVGVVLMSVDMGIFHFGESHKKEGKDVEKTPSDRQPVAILNPPAVVEQKINEQVEVKSPVVQQVKSPVVQQVKSPVVQQVEKIELNPSPSGDQSEPKNPYGDFELSETEDEEIPLSIASDMDGLNCFNTGDSFSPTRLAMNKYRRNIVLYPNAAKPTRGHMAAEQVNIPMVPTESAE